MTVVRANVSGVHNIQCPSVRVCADGTNGRGKHFDDVDN
jgi:hypothetical protein